MTQKNAIATVFTGPQGALERWLPLIKKYSAKHRVPWRWLAATMGKESSYGRHQSVILGLSEPRNPASVSDDKLSYGLNQVVPSTADWMLGRANGTTKFWELNDPDLNLDVSARYFAYLMKTFPGNREFIVRGYNGGPGFQSTPRGKTDTPIYHSKWIEYLNQVMRWYPGNEMEIG